MARIKLKVGSVSSRKEDNHFYQDWINDMPKKSIVENHIEEGASVMSVEEFDGYTEVAIDTPEEIKIVNGEAQKIKIDFSSSNNFPLVPEGNIRARVDTIEVKQGAKGPYLNVTWIVSEDGEYFNSKLWQILSLSPKAAWKIKEFLLASGLDEEDIKNFELDKNSANFVQNEELFERECMLRVAHQTNTNTKQLQASVAAVMYLEDSGPSF